MRLLVRHQIRHEVVTPGALCALVSAFAPRNDSFFLDFVIGLGFPRTAPGPGGRVLCALASVYGDPLPYVTLQMVQQVGLLAKTFAAALAGVRHLSGVSA